MPASSLPQKNLSRESQSFCSKEVKVPLLALPRGVRAPDLNSTLAAARFRSQWPEAVFLLAPAERPRVLATTPCFPNGSPSYSHGYLLLQTQEGEEVENYLEKAVDWPPLFYPSHLQSAFPTLWHNLEWFLIKISLPRKHHQRLRFKFRWLSSSFKGVLVSYLCIQGLHPHSMLQGSLSLGLTHGHSRTAYGSSKIPLSAAHQEKDHHLRCCHELFKSTQVI